MAADCRPGVQPRSHTLMPCPVDCRVNLSEVRSLATSKPIDWFAQQVISDALERHKGYMRTNDVPGLCADHRKRS